MKGKYKITVSNRDVNFKFSLERNITLVVGNSATGKTTLYNLISEHMRSGAQSGVNLSCEKRCVVLDDIEWKLRLKNIKDSIVFIDEGVSFISTKEFAREIKKTDNYYVIFNRENLKELPYSIDEIYEIKRSGRYCRFEKYYQSDERYLYSNFSDFVPDYILVEDSKSGFQFFNTVFSGKNIKCVSAKGNSNIFKWLDENKSQKVLVIGDGAAFGSYANEVMLLISRHSDNIKICLPESFEWMILSSGIIDDNNLREIISDPSKYIESREYFSWEQFFTSLLEINTSGTHREYSKKKINEYYLSAGNINSILSVLNGLFDNIN